MKQLKKTILTLVALLAVTTGAWAQEETKIAVGGSTQNNNFVPLPSTLAQNYTKCEFVYPATMLTALNGYDIKGMTFGATAGSQSWGDAQFQVFLKEVDFTTISAYSGTDNATTVYEGVLYLLGSTHEMEITFTIPYTYHGGNLLIGVYQTVKGNKGALPQWLGEDATGASVRGYSSSSLDAVTTATQCNFLPKVTFTCVSSASTGPEVTWNAASKTGTFDMPGGNVTVSVEYYPQATLAFQGLTAAEDAAAKTDAPLAVVADGAVAGGTLMYYVATDENFTQADAIALAETQWSADIPTAETVEAAGTCYVWYYIKGDAEHSDTDPQRLAVTLLPEPTYTVEFAEGTPESDKWKADPAAGVKKDQTVTVTYTGSKKVIGVKAEKKAAAKVLTITVAKGSTDLSGDKLLYYTPGETYRQAIANHPENKLDGGLGWNIWEGGNDATIFYKESADKARDLSIDGDQHFRPTDSINLDTVIDPTLNFYFVAQF